MSSIASESGGYKVFPRHVGKWEGLVRILDANLQEINRHRIAQAFKAFDHKWVIENTYLYEDGTSLTHSFDIIPTGNGEVKVETAESLLRGAAMKAHEYGDNIVNFQVLNSATGNLQELETITLVNDQDRVRTAQIFESDGTFKGLMVIVERRVD
ncbi:hypothetical protein K9N68_00755 [Kovacikia minuta CCNUW1]|uniref:hypothetical protein n=1 Tax=Kovacikia minuta TaxID=2931930 RepID=UPI001CCDB34B|nr:hypothetical protein [Kovacikia minuta]UBF26577.1 hypothetical protein K9N68_00755 [Kovacikia minuta CCNUW1]